MTAAGMAEEIATLRETIRANDGTNVATPAFARKVEQLIRDFYDDIGELTDLRLSDILDLFLIQVLYVNRRSRDAETLDYLGRLLERCVRSDALGLRVTRERPPYLSDLLAEKVARERAETQFELYRDFGDRALFVSGVFPQSLGARRHAGRMGGAPRVDREYLIVFGTHYYERAAQEATLHHPALTGTLLRLSQFFEVYVDALNEMSGRYVLGVDLSIIADKMLDAFNRYRATRERQHLDTARKYAALLKLDERRWPALGAPGAEAPTYF